MTNKFVFANQPGSLIVIDPDAGADIYYFINGDPKGKAYSQLKQSGFRAAFSAKNCDTKVSVLGVLLILEGEAIRFRAFVYSLLMLMLLLAIQKFVRVCCCVAHVGVFRRVFLRFAAR